MNSVQASEYLILGLLLAGALSTSYTIRSEGNYLNFYDALAGLDLKTTDETYVLDPETYLSISFQLRNPTPYRGLTLDSFQLLPEMFQTTDGRFPVLYGDYAIVSLTNLRNAELPANTNLTLAARILLKGEAVQQFREFYHNQTGHITLVYEASVRVHSILDKYCVMTLHFTAQGPRSTCALGSSGISDAGP